MRKHSCQMDSIWIDPCLLLRHPVLISPTTAAKFWPNLCPKHRFCFLFLGFRPECKPSISCRAPHTHSLYCCFGLNRSVPAAASMHCPRLWTLEGLGFDRQHSVSCRLHQVRRSQRGSNQLASQPLASLTMYLHLPLSLPLPLDQRMSNMQQLKQARRRREAVGALRWISLSGNGSPLQGGVGWMGCPLLHAHACLPLHT